MPSSPSARTLALDQDITALAKFMFIAWLSDIALAWESGGRSPGGRLLLLSLILLLTAAFGAGLLAMATRAGNVFRRAAFLLMLAGSFLLWSFKNARALVQPPLISVSGLAIIIVLVFVPILVARLPARALITVTPLLIFGYDAAKAASLAAPISRLLLVAGLTLFGFLLARKMPEHLPWRNVVTVGAALVIVASTLLVHWGHESHVEMSTEGTYRPQHEAARQPNIVLIVVDTWRADRLGIYGYRQRATSPFLDAFAGRATVYDQAYASSSWTVPSVATMFTGMPPEVHGMTVFGSSVPPSIELVTEEMRRRGYCTIGISTNPLIGPKNGFARGFHVFVALTRLMSMSLPASFWSDAMVAAQFWSQRGLIPRLPGDWSVKPRAANAVNEAIQQLDRVPHGSPTFIYLHLIDPHYPCSAPEDEATRAWMPTERDRAFDAGWSVEYDRELRYVDGQLARFISAIDKRLEAERTTIIIVGDHGEELGESGKRGHGINLDEALLRVPLVVRWSGAASPGVVSTPFSLVHLRDLMIGTARSQPVKEPIRAHLIPPSSPDVMFRSIQSGLWKLVDTISLGSALRHHEQLFLLPDEHTDRLPKSPVIATALRADLNALPVTTSVSPYDAESRRKLRSIGYLH